MHTELKGVVLRTVDIRESDRLLTIYSDTLGLITASARGSRTLKSRKMPATGQFCYSEFVLRSYGDKWVISEASLIESFFGLRDSLEALSLAGYLCEIVSEVGTAEPDSDLLRLTLNSLYALSRGTHCVGVVKAAFEMRCASILGFMPDVHSCSRCEGTDSVGFYFDIMGGAIECYDCHNASMEERISLSQEHETHIVAQLTPGARAALEYSILAPIEKLFSFKLPEGEAALFYDAAERYLLNHLERGFRSLDFYKEVTR